MPKRSKHDKANDARVNADFVNVGPDIDESDEYPDFEPCPNCAIIPDPECSMCGGDDFVEAQGDTDG
jgi:hypothetical protein